MNAPDPTILAAARRQVPGDPERLQSAPSLDKAMEIDMSTDANANANQAQQGQGQAPQTGQATQANPTTPGQTTQVPGGQQAQQGQAQQGQGQISDQQAEQVARHLIENQPHLIARAVGHPAQGAPQGAGAAPSVGDLMQYLPQAIAFVKAFASALQAAGVAIPGL
jgi:hypothetical protein